MKLDAIVSAARGLAIAAASGVLVISATLLPAGAAPIALTSLVSPVEGSWQTLNGTEITVAPCDQGFCGSLSWIVIPKEYAGLCQMNKDAFGTQMLDTKNPDPTLRTRSMIGMQMLTLKPTDAPDRFDIHIYNAQDGQSYDGEAWVKNGNNTLTVGGGCVGPVCAVTQDWPRVPVRPDAPNFACTPAQ